MTKESRRKMFGAIGRKTFAVTPKPLGLHRAKHPRSPERREIRWQRVPAELPPKIYFPWPQIIPDTKRAPMWLLEAAPTDRELLIAELPSGAAIMKVMAEKWIAAAKLPVVSPHRIPITPE